MAQAAPDRVARDAAKIVVEVLGLDGFGWTAYEGWLQSEVSRSIEQLCGTFSIPISLVPGAPPWIKRQDQVRILIGGTVVLTGFVLAAEPFYKRGDCGMRITGRSRAGDLVRCSAIHKGGQWRNVRIDTIIKDIIRPFGLDLVVQADIGEAVADFKLGHGETALDAVSRAARLRGVLVMSDDAGRVLLTRAGAATFKGAIVRGQNVIAMEGIGTDEERHSEYFVYGQSHSIADIELARGLKASAKDEEITRYLPLVINADGNTTQAELATLAAHTVRVRRGHAMGFHYTVEGWTVDGQPWPLNQRVAIYDDVAGLAGDEWLIVAVKQTCDIKDGDVTELTVRPVEAYDTAPLKTKVVRRNWGNKGNKTNHPKGPSDKARGG
jgi:prophage tail gpP-like protein